MAHQHFCDAAGHHYDCSKSECECICGLLMEEGDHSDCPVELRACAEHENGVTAEELEGAQEGGAVRIQFPSDIEKRVERAVTSPTQRYEGFCLWCGSGYEKWSPKLENEHFAFHCPDAPEAQKQGARERLKKSTPRRCREASKHP